MTGENDKIMTIGELKNKIIAGGWHFRFLSPNPFNKSDFDWKTLAEVDKNYGGFESYLKKIAESQKLKQLNINTKAKNGTSFLNKGIFLVDIEPVENVGNVEKTEKTVTTNSINSTNPISVTEVEEIKKPKENPITTHIPPMEDLKTHIENASMKTELRFLQAENERLKETNKKLDHKNEELFNEVSKLTRELATDKTKNDLEFQKKELELLQKQKGGLSGIVDEVKNMDPKTLGMIISVFQPNNQAVKALMSSDENSGGSSLNGPKHENSEVQDYIEHSIYPMLTNAPAGSVGMIGGLIEYFIKYPDHLVATYKKWLPGVDATAGTGEDDLDENE